jgi:hypothetical protein
MSDLAPHLHQHFVKFAAFEGAVTQERVDEIVQGMQVAANESGDCRVGSLETAVHAGCKVGIEPRCGSVIVRIAVEERRFAVAEGRLERIGQGARAGQIRSCTPARPCQGFAADREFGATAGEVNPDQANKPVFRLDGGLIDDRLHEAMSVLGVNCDEGDGAKIMGNAGNYMSSFMNRYASSHRWRPHRTRPDQECGQVRVSKRSPFPARPLACLADEPGDIRATRADRLPCKTTKHGILRGAFPQILILQCHGITLPF